MNPLSQYPHYASLNNAEYYLVDGDIILIVPGPGFKDTPAQSRASVEFQNTIARQVGRPCGVVIVMMNVLAQDAESRRIYNEQGASGWYYGAALIVSNPLSRALASFLIGMTRTRLPIQLFDTIENGLHWLRTIRPAAP